MLGEGVFFWSNGCLFFGIVGCHTNELSVQWYIYWTIGFQNGHPLTKKNYYEWTSFRIQCAVWWTQCFWHSWFIQQFQNVKIIWVRRGDGGILQNCFHSHCECQMKYSVSVLVSQLFKIIPTPICKKDRALALICISLATSKTSFNSCCHQ